MDNNIRFQKATTNEIRVAPSELMKKGRMLFNNYYGVNENDDCDIFFSDNTLLIRKKEFHFYRLYVMSLDETDLSMLLNGLCGEEYVLNIPSRKPIDDWDALLKKCGFEFLDVYSRYYNNNIKTFPTVVDSFAIIDEISDIASLLYENFSLYTDHLPTKNELEQMIANRQIITDHKDGKVCGVLIYTIMGNKGYQNAWIDTGDNALELLFKVKSIFIERGIKYCYYWIKDSNKDVIKIHTMMGGCPDGLKDYTYLKK
jgi:hypothetical protein